jgi:acid phosphatase (class A)
MNLTRRILLAAAFLLPALPSLAGDPPYLSAKQLDLRIMLPPPVAAGSVQDKADQDAVIAAQKSASPERIALAAADAEESVFDMFARTLGPVFTPANLPKASVFFTRVGDSEDEVVDPAKPFFGRVRPFLANPEAIKPLVKPSKSGAYPSGHTTRVTAMAIILADMLPEKKDIIWARADEYAQSRVIGGMHHPTDLEAGRRAGTAMAAVMFADPAFRTDYEVVKGEVRKAMGF